MKVKEVLLIITFLVSIQGITQEADFTKDSLRIVSGSLGQNVFVIGDSVVNKNIFRNTISTSNGAYNYFRKGNKLNILSGTMGFLGGAAIGFTVASLIGPGENSYWAVGATGVALLILNYPIKQSSRYNFKKAVDTYNKDLNNETSFWNRSELNLSLSTSSIGFKLTF